MKLAFAVILLIALGASLAPAQSKGKRSPKKRAPVIAANGVANGEQSLLDADKQWNEAFKNSDKESLDRLIADKFIFTDDQGNVYDKTKYVEMVVGTVRVESYELDDLAAHIDGATGVVTGRWTGKLVIGGKKSEGAVRFTDTFVRRGNAWLVLASQETRIPRKDTFMDNAITTPSGLKYVDEVVGTGATPKAGQIITVHYTGTFEDGTKFDSSYDYGKPVDFPIGVGRVIRGWDEALLTMKVGGKRRLVIPPQLAYGARGTGDGRIPPNATLRFVVELIGVR